MPAYVCVHFAYYLLRTVARSLFVGCALLWSLSFYLTFKSKTTNRTTTVAAATEHLVVSHSMHQFAYEIDIDRELFSSCMLKTIYTKMEQNSRACVRKHTQ